MHATATDAEDGTLAPSSLSWVVLRHHDAHTHPFLAPTVGNDDPDHAAGSRGPRLRRSNGYLEIQLTATDSRGVTTTVTRDVQPNRVEPHVLDQPGRPRRRRRRHDLHRAEDAHLVGRGTAFAVDARTQTDGSGSTWNFQSWSDGGAAAHTIVTPADSDDLHRDVRRRARLRPAWSAAYGLRRGLGHDRGGLVGEGECGVDVGAGVECGRAGSARR